MKMTPILVLRHIAAFLLLVLCGRAAGQAWVSHSNIGSAERFLFANRVADYNFETGVWTAIALPRSGATAIAQDATGTYVAYGPSIYQYSPGFTGETLVGSAANSVHGLFLDGNLLIAVHSANEFFTDYYHVNIYSRSSQTQLGTINDYGKPFYGTAHAPGLNKLFGSKGDFSPSDTPDGVLMAGYTDDGVPAAAYSSLNFVRYSVGSRNWISRGELRLINSSGNVYSTSNLKYMTSLGGTLEDVAFNGDLPIVIRGTDLVAFTNTYSEAGKKPVVGTALAIGGSSAFVFSQTTENPAVSIVPLSEISAPEPGQPVNPNGLIYTPDAVFMDRDDNVLLFSKAHLSLFRWSTTQRRFLATLPLVGMPDFAAYSRENHTAYFAYSGGVIRKMDLSVTAPVEVPFYTLPSTANGLAMAGSIVAPSVGNGAWATHFYIMPDGTLGSSADWNYTSLVWTWDPVLRRMYFFRDSMSPNDLHYEVISEAGEITAKGETPYHGDFSATPPIRVSPDGQSVLLGSGTVFNTTDLRYASPLGNAVSDALWHGGKIVSLREISGGIQLQTWEGAQNTEGPTVRQFPGTPLRLLETGSDLWALTLVQGSPRFMRLDDSLQPSYISPSTPLAPDALAVSGRTVSSVSLSWLDNSDNEDGFNVEYRTSGGTWTAGPRAGANTPSATVTGLNAGTAYEFRVAATVETLVSAASTAVSAQTLTQPDQPVGEPYNLRITRIFSNSVTLEWTDNATNETGFTIYRSTSPASGGVALSAPAGAQSWTDSGVAANTLYYYRVQAVNGASNGDLSAEVSARTMNAAVAPASPRLDTVQALSATSVEVKWTDNSTNEDQFTIERAISPFAVWQSAGTVTFNVSTFTDTAAVPATNYAYRVLATNASGSSASYYLTVTTPKLGGEFLDITARAGNVYYFAFAGPDRIERYDILAHTWLPAIPLNTAAKALWADDAGIYAGEGRLLVHINPADGTRTPYIVFQNEITNLVTVGDILLATTSVSYTTMNRASGLQLGTWPNSFTRSGFSTAPGIRRVFSRRNGAIQFLELNAEGTPSTSGESPCQSCLGKMRTFVFPNEAHIVDDSGAVYSTSNLTYTNSLGGGPLTDITFDGQDIPILLRNDKLFSYTNKLLEAGSYTLPGAGIRLAFDGSDALVFNLDATNNHGLSVTTVDLSLLSAPEPGQPVNPEGLAYTPDAVFMDRDGNVLLFSKAHHSLFRWSTIQHRYLSSLPLIGEPDFAAYSRENHTAYFVYSGGMIRKMDLSVPSPVEVPFHTLPYMTDPYRLATAGSLVVGGGGGTSYISPDGTLLSPPQFGYSSQPMTWDPVLRRLYHFRDFVYPRDLHYEVISPDGHVTAVGETPYDGEFTATPPIRISPDGQQVLLGSGAVFNATDLTFGHPLGNAVTDALWRAGRIVSLRGIGGGTQLQTWEGAQNTAGATVRQFNGTPLLLLETSSDLWALTLVLGTPRFMRLDDSLQPAYISPSTPQAPGALAVSGRTFSSISLSWLDNSDSEDGFTVEYRASGGIWAVGPRAAANTLSATVSGLNAGTAYEFRVTASVGTLVSAASPVISILTLTGPDQPVGEPYNLRITRIFNNSITLEWTDNASNETGFTLYRSTSPGAAGVALSAPPGFRSYTDSGVSANTRYYYRVQAVNGSINGDLSAQVNARTMSAAAVPAAPSLRATISLSATAVEVTWTDNSTNENQFTIERAVSPFTVWQSLGSVAFNTTTFTDNTVTPGTSYYYRVRAANSTGSSESNRWFMTTPKFGGDFRNITAQAGSVYYFAFAGPDRIERYDMVARAWLPSISLFAAATALWADDAGIYAGEGRRLVHINPADGTRTTYISFQTDISSLITVGNILLAASNGSYATMNRTSGLQLEPFANSFFGGGGFSAAPAMRRIFARVGGSPTNIQFLELTAAGTFASVKESPYFGYYPDAGRTFVFPNGSRVVDDSGTVYSTTNLTYTNSLGGAFTDIAFSGQNIPIVLRSDKLHSYNNKLLEVGSFTLPGAGIRVTLDGDEALVFNLDATNTHGVSVTPVALSLLRAPEPGQPANPVGLAYTPDAVFMDRDDNVLLFSKAHRSLFRWSTTQRRYLTTLPLVGVPEFAAYSKENHTVYFAYSGGMIRKITLNAPTLIEEPFHTLPYTPYSLATAGNLVVGVAGGNSYISPDGTLLSSLLSSYYSRTMTWDPVRRRLYHLRDESSYADLHFKEISTAGIATSAGQTPNSSTISPAPPIRVSPDGQRVLLGSGVAYETGGLTQLGSTLPALVDAVWSGGKVYTAATGTSQTILRSYNPTNFAAIRTLPSLTGTPVRLLNLPASAVLAVTLDAEKPRFFIMDAAETITFDSIRDNTAPVVQGLTIRTTSGRAIALSVAKILARATDAEGDSISFTGAATATTRNGTASVSAGIVQYTPAPGFSGEDQLTVTLTDGRGKAGTSALIVQVEAGPGESNPPQLATLPDGSMNLHWSGIPGRTYAIQRSIGDLTNWTTLGTVTADTHGRITFSDTPGVSSAFYRIALP